VPDYRVSTARTSRRSIGATLAIAIWVSLGPATIAADDGTQQKKTTKPPSKQSSQVPPSLLRAVRTTVSASAKVKNVRSPRSGIVRVVLDQPLVKETEYHTALVGSCSEILKAKAERTAATLEIVSADERQGYVYRPTSNCKDVIAAAEDRRRMIILPQTTVFRAPR
jgi:hypothetical protein